MFFSLDQKGGRFYKSQIFKELLTEMRSTETNNVSILETLSDQVLKCLRNLDASYLKAPLKCI